MKKLFFLLCFILCFALSYADEIETFYGKINVEEPVLLELIKSPAFERLKHIHQYGIAYYTSNNEDFSRYDHSLGVFFLLRENKCSLKEQIAGLLHDVSHTIFSHVGDWIFKCEGQESDYQTLTHCDYLEKSGLGAILSKHGFKSEEILPKQADYPALEQPLPTLCADRLDYNIQGAFHQGFLTKKEAIRLAHKVHFHDGEWVAEEQKLLKKMVRFSLYMTEHCWGSQTEYVTSMWLAEAILRGLEINLLTLDDIRFGVDDDIWNRLLKAQDPLIQTNMAKISNPSAHHTIVANKEGADLFVVTKFRGIDPYLKLKNKRVRLTSQDPKIAAEYTAVKNRMARGFGIKLAS